jgi:hypothetical protein
VDRLSLQALYLDDNHYPRHIWSFTFLGKTSDTKGPPRYSLAHLFVHKDYNHRDASDELSGDLSAFPMGMSGLFTSAANTAYIHQSVVRPTDWPGPLRRLLQRRLIELYGEVCEPLPPGLRCAPLRGDDFDPSDFRGLWAPQVGDLAHLDAFLAFRADRITQLLHGT